MNGKLQPDECDSRFARRHDSHERAASRSASEIRRRRSPARRFKTCAFMPASLAEREIASLAQLVACRRSSPLRRISAARPTSTRFTTGGSSSVDDEYQVDSRKSTRRWFASKADMQARSTTGYVMQEKPEAPIAFVLNRGEYDQRKDQVAPATPAMLPAYPRRSAAQSPGVCQVAAAARASAHGARHRQSILERSVRHGPREDGRRFRRLGRVAVASGIARLAGRRVSRIGLGREEAFQADGHVGHVSAKRGRHAGEAREGSGEPPALARPAVPHGCRNGSRLCARRERAACRQRSAGRA